MASGRQNFLAGCAAIACCSDGPQLRSLERFGAATGFGLTLHFQHMTRLDDGQPRVLFFLVHFELSDEGKAALLHQLRSQPAPRFKFAPIILISQDCDFETMLRYVEMGFDDVICLPDSSSLLQDRLLSQLNRDILYVETASYFGPDRRRMELRGAKRKDLESAAHMHTRLVIHRSVAEGIVLVSQQKLWDRAEI